MIFAVSCPFSGLCNPSRDSQQMNDTPVKASRDPAKPNVEQGWLRRIGNEFSKPYMAELREFLRSEKSAGKVIFPHSSNWFAALSRTSFDGVRVVILGQDPYHGPNQAHGLCFSVLPGVEVPPSLRNIYKELSSDVGFQTVRHGCLNEWADQGVLLLNATLTVLSGQAGSHQNKGWETFTDRVISSLNNEREGLVFLLWGSYAQKKGAVIDENRHLVLRAPHPSPLSAHRGFFGCQHFSKANAYLKKRDEKPIVWQLGEIATK